MSLLSRLACALVIVAGLGGLAAAEPTAHRKNFAGSMQIDYLALVGDSRPRDQVLDGSTVELSLKLAADVSEHATANVKVCVACHGLEVGMAFLDLQLADELSLRVGRFTPAFGNFPLRHDPANHHTSDKPLPYDMGRMPRFREWNEGILPAPWVDNGVELHGVHFVGDGASVDYAGFLVSGPKGSDFDFDYKASRSPEAYYVDNNSEPSAGGRLALSVDLGEATAELGASTMVGHYDAAGALGFALGGAEAVLQLPGLVIRGEYLLRRTHFALGPDPASRLKFGPGANGRYDSFVVEDGFYGEVEVPIQRVSLIARWDGLRRRGNVLAGSQLSADSSVYRYTGAVAVDATAGVQVKASVEACRFSDFGDELAAHLGVAAAF